MLEAITEFNQQKDKEPSERFGVREVVRAWNPPYATLRKRILLKSTPASCQQWKKMNWPDMFTIWLKLVSGPESPLAQHAPAVKGKGIAVCETSPHRYGKSLTIWDHRACETINFLEQQTPDFIPPTLWPPNLPDLKSSSVNKLLKIL